MSAAGVAEWDVVVVGSGPAGQQAAIQAARCGRHVLLVEREVDVGGACVHRGTIPSKTLRETALSLHSFRRRSGDVFPVQVREDLQVASLMTRMEQVVKGHERTLTDQLRREGVAFLHGRARFASPHELEVTSVDRTRHRLRAGRIVLAVGSKPRSPPEVPIDHMHVLDSDSILSMIYLPRSLVVLGAGVIAAEYASIFAALGVRVTMIDKGERPLGFLDPEMTGHFLASFEAMGGRFLGRTRIASVAFDDLSEVVTTLDDGTEIRSDKLLCCLGRVAHLDGLALENAGLAPTDRGLIAVDEQFRTAVPHILAVGDVIGPPSLASTSMGQGRRAMCHAFGVEAGSEDTVPVGIYTIPEMASVGLDEAQAIARHGAAVVGRARFEELPRGLIAAMQGGLLKIVADPAGEKLLGVQIVGEGAADLIHVGEMALLHDACVDLFVDATFNFPTLAEAYRAAALDVVWQRSRQPTAAR